MTQFSQFTPNVVDGKREYETGKGDCVSCHGLTGNGTKKLIVSKYPTSESLFRKVYDTMPFGDTGSLEGQVAADITAYLDTWRAQSTACGIDTPVLYGERSLKLLTSFEYRNSVQDLFPSAVIPSQYLETAGDVAIGGFPSHYNAVVNGAVADIFYANAEKIADWAIAQSLPFACTDKALCADKFINEFAYKAFRRPLADNAAGVLEITAFRNLFAQALTAQQGLRWAIVASLVSPNFLYRSELGIPAADARAKGWGAPPAGTGDYEPAPGGVTVKGADFTTKSTGVSLADGTHNIYTSGNITQRFTLSDPAFITLNVRANDFKGAWPEMTVSLGTQVLAKVLVTQYEPKMFQFLVTGRTGPQTLTIAYSNVDQGEMPYGRVGFDKDLLVIDATVSAATKKVSTAAKSAVDLATTDSFVLDPYEYASALSYMYTGSLPDSLLLAAANSGDINSPAVAAAQIDRMQASPRGQQHMRRFVALWMQTGKLYDQNFIRSDARFSDKVRDSMAKEVEEMFSYVFNNNVPFSEFYTADYTFLDATLASFYGIARNDAGAGAAAFVKTPTTVRGGALTSGAFLTTFAHPDTTSPILRAVYAREIMLCHHIAPPPALNGARELLATQVEALKASGTLTTRGYYESLTNDPLCASCHEGMINPLGGGLEDFSEIGLPQTQQKDIGLKANLIPVDAAGTLVGTQSLNDGLRIPFSGAKALSKTFGRLDSTQACLAEKAFRFGTGHALSPNALDLKKSEAPIPAGEVSSLSCATEKLSQSLRTQNQSPKALFKTLGTLDLIRIRR